MRALRTGRVGPGRVGSGRVGSGRVGSGRVGPVHKVNSFKIEKKNYRVLLGHTKNFKHLAHIFPEILVVKERHGRAGYGRFTLEMNSA